jgi:hypothetical protein
MSDESIEITGNGSSAFSRRNALKAGVALGVGAAAWSGATITSLGGTPAYATPGCTGVVVLDLSGGCRNTDQANSCATPPLNQSKWRWHTLNNTGFPSGYSVNPNIAEGTCCTDAGNTATLNFPSGQTCEAFVQFWSPGGGGGECSVLLPNTLNLGTSQSGTLIMTFGCPSSAVGPSDKYTIVAKCHTTGANPCCIDPAGC